MRQPTYPTAVTVLLEAASQELQFHQPSQHGPCPICRHHGTDCTAWALQAAVNALFRYLTHHPPRKELRVSDPTPVPAFDPIAVYQAALRVEQSRRQVAAEVQHYQQTQLKAAFAPLAHAVRTLLETTEVYVTYDRKPQRLVVSPRQHTPAGLVRDLLIANQSIALSLPNDGILNVFMDADEAPPRFIVEFKPSLHASVQRTTMQHWISAYEHFVGYLATLSPKEPPCASNSR